MLRRLLVVAILLFVIGCRRGHATDLDGHPVDPLDGRAAVVVLVFVGAECPISNRYAPEIARLREKYARRGVGFWLVYPNGGVEAIRRHLEAHALGGDALRDPAQVLVRRAGATRTPEAAVFSHGALVYRGRIDDRQVDFGIARPEASERDLEDAIEAVLAGRSPHHAVTTAVGCSIPPS